MSKGKTYTVKFRRKRRGETNYRKRLKVLLSNKLRLVIRKSLNNITAQIVEYHSEGDRIILAVNSKMLDKFGWRVNKGNLPSAYLVGLLIGKEAKKRGIDKLVPCIGLNKAIKGSRVFAVLKGVVDAGVDVPHSEEILPEEDRVRGAHIAKYAEILKKSGAYERVFSDYIRKDVDPAHITEYFEKSRKRIMEAS